MIEVVIRCAKKYTDEELHALVYAMEPIVGRVLEEEMDRVDITVQPYNDFDEHSTDFLFKVLINEDCVHHDAGLLAEQLEIQIGEAILECIHPIIVPSYRVWFMPITNGVLFPK